MKKKILWTLAIIFVLLVSGLLIVWSRLDSIVRTVVQSQSQEQLKVPTQLAGANVSLMGGAVSLTDLVIGPPAGFKDNIFTLGEVGVKVSYGELSKQPVHIQSINLDKPRLVLEQSGGKFNIKALMDNLPKAEPTDTSKDSSTMRLIIDSLTISDATVVIKPGLGLAGLDKDIEIKIPTLQMKNIGNDDSAQNGAALKEVVMLASREMAAKAVEVGNLPEPLKLALSGDLDNLTKQFADKLGHEAQKALGDVQAQVQQQADKAVKGVQDNVQKEADKAVGNLLNGLGGNKNKEKPKEPGK